jgi:3-dehydroquinate dehydratase I
MYCLSTGSKNFNFVLAEIIKYEIAEIRLDLCEFDKKQIKMLFSSHSNLIATYRNSERISYNKKRNILKTAIKAGAKWVDLDFENNTHDFIIDFSNYAHDNGVKIIISKHDYNKVPDNEEIYSLVEQINKYQPDLIKLAFYSNSIEDNERVLALYSRYQNILAFNMGEKGKITRVKSLLFGSPFAYVRSEIDQTAAGQMTLQEMMQYPQ